MHTIFLYTVVLSVKHSIRSDVRQSDVRQIDQTIYLHPGKLLTKLWIECLLIPPVFCGIYLPINSLDTCFVSSVSCGMYLLIHALYTCFYHLSIL